jgi:NAD(P)-dependent dehydrogenase (short-subunit alcohol dehydrogenase family)
VDAAVMELNRLWAQSPAPHLFITTAREEKAVVTESDWPSRSIRGVHVPYFVCQRWLQLVNEAGLARQGTLVGLTALGGDFGFAGRIAGVEGGGVAGLFKAIRREFPGLTVKVIDAPLEESPAQLAAFALRELAAATPQAEIGYVRGERLLPRAVPQSAASQRPAAKAPHGTWVVTGGARGVTAVVARELGKRFGLSMHLLGSSPAPNIDPTWRNLTEEGLKTLKRTVSDQARAAGKNPVQTWKEIERAIEIDRTLQAFRADGVDVVYHACDVTDRASLATTLDRIRKEDGAIHGVIHGAGVEAACKFEKKKRENVLATLAVKVDAAMSLLELTKIDPLGWFIGFGSTSGRFGGLGQTDYSMASDLLCKICDGVRAARPDVAAVGFHWPPWADVGMAARPESKLALQSGGLVFMPPLEGVAHVVNELTTMMHEGEILCIDKPDTLDLDGTMCTAAERGEYRRRDHAIRSAAIIDGIHELATSAAGPANVARLTATARFNPVVEPFLLEHRHQGVPILPAVVGMESMAEAANILAGGGKKVVGVKNMTIHQGFRFHTVRPQTAQVAAQQTEGGIRCELRADFCDRHGRLVEPHRLQMDAVIELADAYEPLPRVNLGPTPGSWTVHKYHDDWQTMKFPEDGRVYHGYPFRGLKEYALVDDGLWGTVTAPLVSDIAGERNADGWLLPSATIDAGLLGCDLYVWNAYRSARLPQGFDRIRLARPLKDGEPLTFRMWLRSGMGPVIVADFVMIDAEGNTVLQVDGFRMVEVKSGTGASTAAHSTFDPNSMERRSTPRPENATRLVEASDVAALPLIDSARWVSDNELYAELMFDPVKDVFLAQHKLGGRPILPAVIGMESLIEAASLALPGERLVAVREFVIANGFRFKTDDPQAARVRVRLESGRARCELVGGEKYATVYQSALIEMGDRSPSLALPGPGQPPFPYNPMVYPDEAQLVHGKMFRALKQLFLQRDGGWAIVAGYPADNLAGQRKGDRWFLPPAVLDSCLVACGVDMFIQLEKRVEVPYSCEEFKLVRRPQPKEQCVLRLHYRGHDARHTTYDFTLFGAEGDVILTANGYRGIVTGLEGDASHWDGQSSVSL